MANLSLTPRLRQLVSVLVNAPRISVGDKLPISIQQRLQFFQTIIIFPEDGYTCFTSTEFGRILLLVGLYGCDACICVRGNVPVIEITDYNLSES